jgi:hypothetical protein
MRRPTRSTWLGTPARLIQDGHGVRFSLASKSCLRKQPIHRGKIFQMKFLQMNLASGLSAIVAFEQDVSRMPSTPHDLVSKVAELLHMPVSRVKNFDRKLMEAGLRSKKGHGRGSAIMNSADAAMLLVAIASSDEVSFAAQSAQFTRKIPLASDEHQPTGGLAIICDRIGGRPSDYANFGDAIDAIMNHLVDRDRDYKFSFRVGAAGQLPRTGEIVLFDRDEVQRIRFTRSVFLPSMGGLSVERTVLPSALSGIASHIAGRPAAEPSADDMSREERAMRLGVSLETSRAVAP